MTDIENGQVHLSPFEDSRDVRLFSIPQVACEMSSIDRLSNSNLHFLAISVNEGFRKNFSMHSSARSPMLGVLVLLKKIRGSNSAEYPYSRLFQEMVRTIICRAV